MPLPPEVLAKRQARYLVFSATSSHPRTADSNNGPTVDGARLQPLQENNGPPKMREETRDPTSLLVQGDVESRTILESAKDWACEACTFVNRPGTLACDVCQTQRSSGHSSGHNSDDTSTAGYATKQPRLDRDSSPEISHGPDAFLRALACAGGRTLPEEPASSSSDSSSNRPPNSSAPLPLAYQPTGVPQRAPTVGPSALRLLSWNVDGLCDDGRPPFTKLKASFC